MAPIDADDVWHPTKIERQIERIVRRPNVGLVSVWSRKIDEQDIIIGSQLPLAVSGDVYVLMLLVNFIGTGSAPLIRREVLEEGRWL